MRVRSSGLPGRTLSPELCPPTASPSPSSSSLCDLLKYLLSLGTGWAGLGGRESLRLPEAALSPVHPCRLSSAEEAISELPPGPSPAKPPSASVKGLCLPFSWGSATAPHPTRRGGLGTRGAGARLAPAPCQGLRPPRGPGTRTQRSWEGTFAALGPGLRLRDPAAMGRPIGRKSPLD